MARHFDDSAGASPRRKQGLRPTAMRTALGKAIFLLLGIACVPAYGKDQLPIVSTAKITKTTARYRVDIEYPQTGNQRIDASLARWARADIANFAKWVKQAGRDRCRDPESCDLAAACTVKRNDSQLFALLCEEDTDFGGAHPGHADYTFNFVLPRGTPLQLKDVLDEKRGLAALRALVIADLHDLFPNGDAKSQDLSSEGLLDWVAPSWNNFRNFVLMPTELVIYFPPQTLDVQPRESHIPLAALQAVLRPGVRALAAPER